MSRFSVPEVSLPDAPDAVVWVVCLCAEWCGLCRDYEAVFAQMAQRFPAFRFVWLDIEDQAELVGDMDVETFPTLAGIAGKRQPAGRAARARHEAFAARLAKRAPTLDQGLKRLRGHQNCALGVAMCPPKHSCITRRLIF